MKRVGYLGPVGTNSHEAVLVYGRGIECEFVEYADIPGLICGVDRGAIDEAVVPVENSIEGTVNITIDMLIHEVDLKICGELIIPIRHCLMVRPGMVPEEIELILSHPEALAQCRRFLYNEMSGVETRPVSSTAAAARMVSDSCCPWAAIASSRAAGQFGLEIIREGIEGYEENSTRFIVLSRSDMPATGSDKTSIAFTVDHRPGSLYHALGIFASHGVNLTKIESRPMKTLLGQYLFLVDIEGHRDDIIIRRVLEKLSNDSKYFLILGSYPKFSFEGRQETRGV